MESKKIAVVTGANRGIGLEICRQLARNGVKVMLTSRDALKGEAAVDGLRGEELDIAFHQLDVTDPASVGRLGADLQSEYGRLDILINNAGVMPEHGEAAGVFTADVDLVRGILETNTLGPLRVAQALIPLMGGEGRVVNVSSGMGQLAEMNGGWPGYRLSKAALNALTRILAAELEGTRVKVNSVCPGWVRTDMGGPGASRSVEQGAETPVWLALLPDDGPTGGFFRDKQPIPW
jgi:NAD(P)-dependent dehydrogenase (short-subunit alcohol dehydrogenase family)